MGQKMECRGKKQAMKNGMFGTLTSECFVVLTRVRVGSSLEPHSTIIPEHLSHSRPPTGKKKIIL